MASNSHSQNQPMVLEYDRRRYDGGTEREMIEQIEHQQAMIEQMRQAHHHHPMVAMRHPHVPTGHTAVADVELPQHPEPMPVQYTSMPMPAPMMPHPHMATHPGMANPMHDEVQPTATVKVKRHVRVAKALVVPFVELILGFCGLTIAMALSCMSFKHTNDVSAHPLSKERDILVYHSWQVIKDSAKNVLLCPLRVIQAAVLP